MNRILEAYQTSLNEGYFDNFVKGINSEEVFRNAMKKISINTLSNIMYSKVGGMMPPDKGMGGVDLEDEVKQLKLKDIKTKGNLLVANIALKVLDQDGKWQPGNYFIKFDTKKNKIVFADF